MALYAAASREKALCQAILLVSKRARYTAVAETRKVDCMAVVASLRDSRLDYRCFEGFDKATTVTER